MITIKCPECDAETKLSFVDSSYEGPRRCWKCRSLFTIKIVNDELKSCEPLSEEEYERQQEIAAMKAKMRRNDA